MAYSGEVLRRARLRLEQAKADREAENQQHKRLAYEKVPRLAEIDRELRLSMAQVARTVFQQGLDPQGEFDRIRRENQALQREREWLIEDNFEEGYLDDTPICTICGGSGYVGSRMCECLRELCRQEQRRELTLLTGAGQETFAHFRLDCYPDRFDPHLGASPRDVMALTLATCKRYAQSFTTKSPSLLFNGNPGLGKTFLSTCIARAVVDGGHSVIYVTAGQFFAVMDKARFQGDPEAQTQTERYKSCDLLILDDLGSELVTAPVQSALYTIVNDRLLAGLPTIISSNLQSVEFSNRYGPATASRLLGSYRQVTFVGQDIRLMKATGGPGCPGGQTRD